MLCFVDFIIFMCFVFCVLFPSSFGYVNELLPLLLLSETVDSQLIQRN